jgi:hypothetical protein
MSDEAMPEEDPSDPEGEKVPGGPPPPFSKEATEEANRLQQIVEDATIRLSEHFDSVQIVVTGHNINKEMPSTILLHSGRGNLYSRLASTESWCDYMRRNVGIP